MKYIKLDKSTKPSKAERKQIQNVRKARKGASRGSVWVTN